MDATVPTKRAEREERYILLAETTGSAATVCTTGAADFSELRSRFVGSFSSPTGPAKARQTPN